MLYNKHCELDSALSSEYSVRFSFSAGTGGVLRDLKVEIGEPSECERPRHIQFVKADHLGL